MRMVTSMIESIVEKQNNSLFRQDNLNVEQSAYLIEQIPMSSILLSYLQINLKFVRVEARKRLKIYLQ